MSFSLSSGLGDAGPILRANVERSHERTSYLLLSSTAQLSAEPDIGCGLTAPGRQDIYRNSLNIWLTLLVETSRSLPDVGIGVRGETVEALRVGPVNASFNLEGYQREQERKSDG